jgi:hypothetical protein
VRATAALRQSLPSLLALWAAHHERVEGDSRSRSRLRGVAFGARPPPPGCLSLPLQARRRPLSCRASTTHWWRPPTTPRCSPTRQRRFASSPRTPRWAGLAQPPTLPPSLPLLPPSAPGGAPPLA